MRIFFYIPQSTVHTDTKYHRVTFNSPELTNNRQTFYAATVAITIVTPSITIFGNR